MRAPANRLLGPVMASLLAACGDYGVAAPAPPARTPGPFEVQATDGQRFIIATRMSDAFLASAVHDLACARESIGTVQWESPRGVDERAFDGCGRRAVYRTVTTLDQSVLAQKIVLVNLFTLPH
jgi:hypothetical protein